MRQKVNFKIVYAGAFKSTEKTMEMAAEFASTLEPQQLVSISMMHDGKVIVWYRDR